jgi:hypothetical protein
MKFVLPIAIGDERADIKQIPHGKSTRSLRTISFVRTGASGPASITGNPVIGSSMIFASKVGFLCGVNTIRPSSISASRESPALPDWAGSPAQTTDGHLVQLASANGAVLATLDAGIPGAFLIP